MHRHRNRTVLDRLETDALRAGVNATLPDTHIASWERAPARPRRIGTRATISQSSLLVEMLNGIRVVKALNLESEQANRYRAFSKDLVRSSIKSVPRPANRSTRSSKRFRMLGLGLLIIYVFFSHRTTPEMVGFLSGVLLIIYRADQETGLVHIFFCRNPRSASIDSLKFSLNNRP